MGIFVVKSIVLTKKQLVTMSDKENYNPEMVTIQVPVGSLVIAPKTNDSVADYWQKRCEAAEAFIEESPCDPDIYPAQLEAYHKWRKIADSGTKYIKP